MRATIAAISGGVWRGQALQQTDMWIGKHGGEIWLSSRYVPVSDAEGLVEAVVQIAEDATALQQKRDDERGQIEAIQNTQAVIHFGLDGTILDANELFLKAVGYQRGDIIGQHHAIFVDPVEREGRPMPISGRRWAGASIARASSAVWGVTGRMSGCRRSTARSSIWRGARSRW
jgi:PAS domain-containing protein